jgi:hypothetical protein
LNFSHLPDGTYPKGITTANPIRLSPDLKTFEDWTSCFRDTDGWQVEFDFFLGSTVEEFDSRWSLMMRWGGVSYNPIVSTKTWRI